MTIIETWIRDAGTVHEMKLGVLSRPSSNELTYGVYQLSTRQIGQGRWTQSESDLRRAGFEKR